jgi:hypothetical protein
MYFVSRIIRNVALFTVQNRRSAGSLFECLCIPSAVSVSCCQKVSETLILVESSSIDCIDVSECHISKAKCYYVERCSLFVGGGRGG